jgi:CheY-like chemotaxis protein
MEAFTLGSKKSRKPSILLVDDSEDFTRATKILLQEYELEVALSGSDALELIDKKAPDIMLVDLVMPKMSGLELIKTVRDSYPDITIVALTAIDEEETLNECRSMGVTEYLIKGALTTEQLKETIDRFS